MKDTQTIVQMRHKKLKVQIMFLLSVLGLFSSCYQNKSVKEDVNQQVEKIVSIHHGKSFGMCDGFCISVISYTENNKVRLQKKWRSDETKSDTTELQIHEWNSIVDLINLDTFFNLNEIYGCPDCTDGGSEWIEIKTTNRNYKVTYDYGKDEIPEIEKLIHKLRQLEK